MSIVEFRNVTKKFGSLVVLDGIDLSVESGEVVVVIGPSGSGKSTLLRCINVLEEIDGGDLVVDGISVKSGASQVRLIRQEAGMVFQQFNLFPQMTALDNVAFGPQQVRGLSKAQARDRAVELLGKVGLADRAHHYPHELSGGQQQRVAIARALALKPKLVLFDEPTCLAKLISCVTTTMVMPSSASTRITRSTSWRSSGSSAEVGSSNSTSFGFSASARAIATRCCWPPESSCG